VPEACFGQGPFTKTRILLLDEATSSLNAENEVLIVQVIEGIKEKVTIIFVTHRVSLLPWFDKVIKLQFSEPLLN
jgi:ABC-type bacteriocin/lantibiotic exporter with double-glycine peptidase domain